jgi:polyisoprenoid-binding protein YceI
MVLSRTIRRFAILCAICVLPATLVAQATADADGETTLIAQADTMTAAVEADRSTVSFTSNAPAERIVGTASELSGSISFSPDDWGTVTGTIQFPVTSMRTGNSMRDRHLAGDDWLRADVNPNVTFEITRVEVTSSTTEGERTDVSGVAHGTLTLNGVSKPTTASIEVAVLADTRRVRVNFNLDANIVDHEVVGRRNSIGREVAEVISVEGTVYAGY